MTLALVPRACPLPDRRVFSAAAMGIDVAIQKSPACPPPPGANKPPPRRLGKGQGVRPAQTGRRPPPSGNPRDGAPSASRPSGRTAPNSRLAQRSGFRSHSFFHGKRKSSRQAPAKETVRLSHLHTQGGIILGGKTGKSCRPVQRIKHGIDRHPARDRLRETFPDFSGGWAHAQAKGTLFFPARRVFPGMGVRQGILGADRLVTADAE